MGDESNGNNGVNATATGLYLTNLVTDAVQTTDDAEEIELAERRRKIGERSGTYRVTLPLAAAPSTSKGVPPTARPTPLSLGFSIRQFYVGGEITDQVLHLDTLVIDKIEPATETDRDGGTADHADGDAPSSSGVETISTVVMRERLDRSTSGVYVWSVRRGSPAWEAGIRPGDVLTSTAATFGDAFWPKASLEGVRSALASRRMVSGTASFEFRRTDVAATDNAYELSLARPIGLNLRGTRPFCLVLFRLQAVITVYG